MALRHIIEDEDKPKIFDALVSHGHDVKKIARSFRYSELAVLNLISTESGKYISNKKLSERVEEIAVDYVENEKRFTDLVFLAKVDAINKFKNLINGETDIKKLADSIKILNEITKDVDIESEGGGESTKKDEFNWKL